MWSASGCARVHAHSCANVTQSESVRGRGRGHALLNRTGSALQAANVNVSASGTPCVRVSENGRARKEAESGNGFQHDSCAGHANENGNDQSGSQESADAVNGSRRDV